MDVFVIPAGPDGYELYCEQPFSRGNPSTPASGIVGRLRQRIEDWLRRAEQWDESTASASGSRLGRLHDRVMAWVAERVAEQRLLWNLRRETAVNAMHPDDLSEAQVDGIIKRALQKDLERHQYWVWVDGVLFLVTFIALGPLFLLIPGVANLPALYFGFRMVGHWYSRGGALHGMRRVQWHPHPSADLTLLRDANRLPLDGRERHVREIASRLQLPNLVSFYDRISKAPL
jgi:hypothetical protein